VIDMQTHPSFLALDRLALGGDVPAEIEQHVAQCERCRAHLERVRQPMPVPRWVGELRAPPARGLAGWARERWVRWLWAGGTCALVLLALIVTRAGVVRHDEVYIGARGTAAVGLYVKRGERVFLWDGLQRVQAGDRLRLKLVPEGFTQVAVFTQHANEARPELLFESPLDSPEEVVLPPAWVIDDEPGAEVLIVVLAHGLSAAELQARAQRGPEQARRDVWVRRFTLDKATENEKPRRSNEGL
jgi:hypothetical protein